MRSLRKLYYRLISGTSTIKVPPDVGDFQLVSPRRFVEATASRRGRLPLHAYHDFRSRWQSDRHTVSLARPAPGPIEEYAATTARPGPQRNGDLYVSADAIRAMLWVSNFTDQSALRAVQFHSCAASSDGRLAELGIPTLIIALFFFGGVQLFFALLGEVYHRHLWAGTAASLWLPNAKGLIFSSVVWHGFANCGGGANSANNYVSSKTSIMRRSKLKVLLRSVLLRSDNAHFKNTMIIAIMAISEITPHGVRPRTLLP